MVRFGKMHEREMSNSRSKMHSTYASCSCDKNSLWLIVLSYRYTQYPVLPASIHFYYVYRCCNRPVLCTIINVYRRSYHRRFYKSTQFSTKYEQYIHIQNGYNQYFIVHTTRSNQRIYFCQYDCVAKRYIDCVFVTTSTLYSGNNQNNLWNAPSSVYTQIIIFQRSVEAPKSFVHECCSIISF